MLLHLDYREKKAYLQQLDACVRALKTPGGVVLLPTETVYGLVCRWEDRVARERIYALKGRESSKLLAMFAATPEMAIQAGAEFSTAARQLATHFMPGALTLIVADRTQRYGATVGVRIPDHRFVLDLLHALGEPLASTSANASGHPNASSGVAAEQDLYGSVDVCVEAGLLPAGAQASTVADASGQELRILREGALTPEKLFAVWKSSK